MIHPTNQISACIMLLVGKHNILKCKSKCNKLLHSPEQAWNIRAILSDLLQMGCVSMKNTQEHPKTQQTKKHSGSQFVTM